MTLEHFLPIAPLLLVLVAFLVWQCTPSQRARRRANRRVLQIEHLRREIEAELRAKRRAHRNG